ncbi:MAG: hypothetical protein QOI35_1715 [Cryptosporangiaceae bacterium]|jgi:hypothetical protein|nr:hypothetical protein [Cryptosporangiaceae bacterium]
MSRITRHAGPGSAYLRLALSVAAGVAAGAILAASKLAPSGW